jgi:DNA-binding transcriptional regulator YdaS (Cro superfamily)
MNAESIIDRLGGNAAVAELCEVTPQAVSQWRSGIPRARLLYLRAVRPDVFADEAGDPVSHKREAA